MEYYTEPTIISAEEFEYLSSQNDVGICFASGGFNLDAANVIFVADEQYLFVPEQFIVAKWVGLGTTFSSPHPLVVNFLNKQQKEIEKFIYGEN